MTPQEQPRAPRDPGPLLEAAVAVMTVLVSAMSDRLFQFLREALPWGALGTGIFLWIMVMNNPTVEQLVGVGLYAAFALLLTMIVKRR